MISNKVFFWLLALSSSSYWAGYIHGTFVGCWTCEGHQEGTHQVWKAKRRASFLSPLGWWFQCSGQDESLGLYSCTKAQITRCLIINSLHELCYAYIRITRGRLWPGPTLALFFLQGPNVLGWLDCHWPPWGLPRIYPLLGILWPLWATAQP